MKNKHLSFIETLAGYTPSKQITLRSWQENPPIGSTIWIPGETGPEKMIFEPQYRVNFAAYNRGEAFQKEWHCEEYMKARQELALKFQMRFYGKTIQQDLFGNIEKLELVKGKENNNVNSKMG